MRTSRAINLLRRPRAAECVRPALRLAARSMLLAAAATALTISTAAPAFALPAAARIMAATEASPAAVVLTGPRVAFAGKTIRVTGYVLGRHESTRTATVARVVVYQANGKRWIRRQDLALKGVFSRGATRFTTRLSLSARGAWRLIAVHDADETMGSISATPADVLAVGSKVIALTFDDGPQPGNTELVLKALRAYHARATFFMLGSLVHVHPSLARSIVDDGYQIGDHSWSHADLSDAYASRITGEITSTQRAIREATGVTPGWFRPPYGATSPTVRAVCARLGVRQVTWDIDPADWRGRGASYTATHVIGAARPGAVVLMHDGMAKRTGTGVATTRILRALSKRGYDFVTLDDLVALGLR